MLSKDMVSFDALLSKQEKIAVVGLGYVGLPLAVLLSKHFSVIGFDIDETKVQELNEGKEKMGEVDSQELHSGDIIYTANQEKLKEAKFFIVAVPTPIDQYRQPDVSIIKSASKIVGANLTPGSIVVYESTVYPGVTEDICLPIIEKESKLQIKEDFWIGYSPERVNPGDKEHTIDRVVKVVSGINDASLDVIALVYETIAPIHKAPSIKVAEAAKVIENTQRDLNIALMNELAVLFHKMNISVYDVLDAASTKWNFLPFKPGLVGGHCIGVDPYYLTYKANEVGHTPEVILAGRRMNDSMHQFMAAEIVKKMIQKNVGLADLSVGIYGITFKENVSDVRNSKVAELVQELSLYGVNPKIHDLHANASALKKEYSLALVPKDDISDVDVLIIAVSHNEFVSLTPHELAKVVKKGGLVVDIKHLYDKDAIESVGLDYWSL